MKGLPDLLFILPLLLLSLTSSLTFSLTLLSDTPISPISLTCIEFPSLVAWSIEHCLRSI